MKLLEDDTRVLLCWYKENAPIHEQKTAKLRDVVTEANDIKWMFSDVLPRARRNIHDERTRVYASALAGGVVAAPLAAAAIWNPTAGGMLAVWITGMGLVNGAINGPPQKGQAIRGLLARSAEDRTELFEYLESRILAADEEIDTKEVRDHRVTKQRKQIKRLYDRLVRENSYSSRVEPELHPVVVSRDVSSNARAAFVNSDEVVARFTRSGYGRTAENFPARILGGVWVALEGVAENHPQLVHGYDIDLDELKLVATVAQLRIQAHYGIPLGQGMNPKADLAEALKLLRSIRVRESAHNTLGVDLSLVPVKDQSELISN